MCHAQAAQGLRGTRPEVDAMTWVDDEGLAFRRVLDGLDLREDGQSLDTQLDAIRIGSGVAQVARMRSDIGPGGGSGCIDPSACAHHSDEQREDPRAQHG